MTADVLPDAGTPFGQRVRTRLRSDTVIWIVTVGADGRPQPNRSGSAGTAARTAPSS
jgi:hypothetical protein